MTYSRSNEDEILERLIKEVGSGNRICVDIGAKDIENSNVANLIINEGWRGILVDRGFKNFHNLFEKTGFLPVCLMHAIILPQNVNDLLPKSFQLLSIDIDGQDYHVWKALKAKPPIVVIEYNPRKKGHDIQRQDDQYEWKQSRDWQRYGASRDAMVALGKSKGYKLVDSNNDNLFFILE